MKPRSSLLLATFALTLTTSLLTGCGSGDKEVKSAFNFDRTKIRVVNLTGGPVDGFVGGRKVTGVIQNGTASSVNRMKAGDSEVVVKAGDETWISQKANLDKTKEYSFFAYWQNKEKRGLLWEGDPSHGEKGFIAVRVLNLLPSGNVSGSAKVGGSTDDLGSGIAPGEASLVNNVQPGSITFSAKVGDRTLSLPPLLTAERESYTLVVSQDQTGKPMVNAVRNSERRTISSQTPQ